MGTFHTPASCGQNELLRAPSQRVRLRQYLDVYANRM